MTFWKLREPSLRLDRQVRSLAAGSGLNKSDSAVRGSVEWMGFLHPRQVLAMVGGFAFLAVLWADVNSWPRAGTRAEALSLLAGLSNQSWNLCLGMVDLRRNLPLPILGWTNDGQLSSTNPSLGQSKTNVALR